MSGLNLDRASLPRAFYNLPGSIHFPPLALGLTGGLDTSKHTIQTMNVTTTFTVEGSSIIEYKGIVRGIIVRAPTIAQGIVGGLKNIIGSCTTSSREQNIVNVVSLVVPNTHQRPLALIQPLLAFSVVLTGFQ